MVYLVHLKIGYKDLFFKFEHFENAVTLVKCIKFGKVKELSDDDIIRVSIEPLTNEEFNEKIKEEEEE